MRISGKTLLAIDSLFWLPHRLVELLFQTFGTIHQSTGDRILVIKFMGIGSIIRLATLCEEHHIEKSKITLLTLASNRELCRLMGFNNHLLVRTNNIILFSKDCWNILFSMRPTKLGLIIDYERCSHAVGFYRTLLSLRYRCKSISFESKRLISSNKQIVYPVDQINQEELFMRGIELMPTAPGAYFHHETVAVHSTKILININTSNYLLSRRYFMVSFAEVIRFLHTWDPHLEFYLTGSADEKKYVAMLVKKLHNLPIHDVSGEWNLEKLWMELSGCALFITGDSGPLHLAAYIHVPTIAIWGPTQPSHFGYTGKNQMNHLSLNLPCSPCFKHPASRPARICKGKIDCLQDLPPSKVSEKAILILSTQTSSRRIRCPGTRVSVKMIEPQPTT